MTLSQATAISRTGFHVRRESWAADKWFIIWRGVWFCFAGEILRVVEATDYDKDDLQATDWTTMPAPLVSCPVIPPDPGNPSDPGSPGGSPPGPAFPGFPPDLPPSSPYGPPPGGGGGGSGGGIPSPSSDQHGLTVTFDGLVDTNPHDGPKVIDGCSDGLNGAPFFLSRIGLTSWTAVKSAGIYGPDEGGEKLPITWRVDVTCPTFGDPNIPNPNFLVSLYWRNSRFGISLGGFTTIDGGPVGSPITNLYGDTEHVSGGTATVALQ